MTSYRFQPLARIRRAIDVFEDKRRFARALRKAHPRRCNICGYQGLFRVGGNPLRLDARCPACKSGPRHRLLKLWFDRNAKRIKDADLLHFAPEACLRPVLPLLARNYVSADLGARNANLTLDIEHIDATDERWDCIVCSHVLEHVDDAKALREMYRVLRRGGIALIMTPVIEGWPRTYENPSAVAPAERILHFGQHDHVRYFGADIRDRIRAAGFELSELTAEEPEVSVYGLERGEKVFIARRPER